MGGSLSERRSAVSRIRCRGDKWETDMSLDVNVDIYPLKVCVSSARTFPRHISALTRPRPRQTISLCLR